MVVIVKNHRFLDHEPFGPLHLAPHVILTIHKFFSQRAPQPAKFSEKLVRKKLNQTYYMKHEHYFLFYWKFFVPSEK
jgi:hypothetical protein